jgi:hypothetical protein
VFFSYLGRVAEVLVWFENDLSMRVVKYNRESAQHLRADGSRNIGNHENAGLILRELRERHGDNESSEANRLDSRRRH